MCDEDVRKKIETDCSCAEYKPPCLSLFDRLAIPKGDRVLGVYKCHAYHMSKPRVELIKSRLQELYSMTPEETERYFQEALEKARKIALRRKLRRKLRAEFIRRRRKAQEDCAYRFVYRLLVKSMRFASRNPVPPLVCVRLRNLSDIVLEQFCDLRNINHPEREDPDKTGLFMMTIADWFAIAIEIIYYAVQYKKNKELEELERQQERDQMKDKSESTDELVIQTTEPIPDLDCK